jgi:hypothetical protein
MAAPPPPPPAARSGSGAAISAAPNVPNTTNLIIRLTMRGSCQLTHPAPDEMITRKMPEYSGSEKQPHAK